MVARLEQRMSVLEKEMRRLRQIVEMDIDCSNITSRKSSAEDRELMKPQPTRFPGAMALRETKAGLADLDDEGTGSVGQCQDRGCVGDPGDDSTGSAESQDDLEAMQESGVHELLDGMCYSLKKSSWDATLFAGHAAVSSTGTYLITFGFIFNVFLQLLFVKIMLAEEFWDLELEKDTAAKRWRSHYGHSIEMADPVTGSSLVSRVCGQDDALFTSTKQEMIIRNMSRYMQSFLGKLSLGRTLACASMILFAVSVTAELRDVAYFLSAVWNVRIAPATHFKLVKGQLVLASLSLRRYYLGVSIAILRACIAVILLWGGSRWLAKTVNIEELILNAVALAFILDIDELVYTTISPHRVDNIIDEVEPLPCSENKFLSRYLRPLLFSGACALVIWSIAKDLNDVFAHQERLQEAMCDGYRDFIFGMDAVGVLSYAHTPPFNAAEGGRKEPPVHKTTDASFEADISKAREYIIWQIINFTNGSVGNQLFPNVTKDSMFMAKKLSKLDGRLLALANEANCTDSDDSFERAMYVSTGNLSVKSCVDVTDSRYCDYASTTAVRLYCPESCGCARPESGLVRRLPTDGCPRQCQEISKKSLNTRECADQTLEQLQRSDGWRRLFRGFKQLIEHEEHTSLNETEEGEWEEAAGKTDCKGTFKFLANHLHTALFRKSRDSESVELYARARKAHALNTVCKRGMAGFCPVTCWCANRSEQELFAQESGEDAREFFDSNCPESCKAMAG